MLGVIVWDPVGRPQALVVRADLHGMPLVRLEISGREGYFLTGRVRACLRQMRRDRVRQCIWPEDLPDRWRGEFQPVPVWQLRRALLPQLLTCAARQWGVDLSHGTVLVKADYADASVRQAVSLLAGRCRYLRLDMGLGREQLEADLRSRYGMAPAGTGWLLQVSFTGEAAPRTICLDRQVATRQRVFYQRPAWWPETLPLREELLAALWQAGKLQPEEICVKSIGPVLDRGGETLYNAT